MIKQCILPHLNESRGNAEVDRRNGGGDKPPRPTYYPLTVSTGSEEGWQLFYLKM